MERMKDKNKGEIEGERDEEEEEKEVVGDMRMREGEKSMIEGTGGKIREGEEEV